MAEGCSNTAKIHSSSLYLYNPVHSPKVFHLNRSISKSPFMCSLSNSKPSPLLHNHCNNNSHGNNTVIFGCKNSETNPTSSRNYAFDNAFLRFPNNTVGVIGGVSTASTLGFLQKLVELSSHDESAHPLPFIVCNNPGLDSNNSLTSEIEQILENLRQQRMFLERSGAGCIAMPCQTLQAWHGEISKGSSVPFLHSGDCVAKELEGSKLKPVEAVGGPNVRIGLLANYDDKCYQEILQNQGYEVIYPDKATVEHTVIPAVSSFKRKDMQGARQLLRIAIQILLTKGVSVVILASDDICQILPHDDPLLVKCVNPVDSLAKQTVAWATSIPFSTTQIT